VPHIPDFLRSLVGSREPHAPFLKERRTRCLVRCRVQEIRGISVVFREIWDATALHVLLAKVSRAEVSCLQSSRRAVEYVEKYRKPAQSILHTIQTNGTLLDDEWCAFFK
jgi:hypothetical protein